MSTSFTNVRTKYEGTNLPRFVYGTWRLSTSERNSLYSYATTRVTYWAVVDSLTSNEGKLRHKGLLYDVVLMGKHTKLKTSEGLKASGEFVIQFRQYQIEKGEEGTDNIINIAVLSEAYTSS